MPEPQVRDDAARCGYCLSAFPDVWKDKLVVAREIRKAWNRALRKAR